MSDTDLLIHLGYHKTASTWLASRLFKNADAGFCRPWQRADIVSRFSRVGPFEFDAEEARAYYAEGIAEARHDGLIPVLTDERLSGHPESGGFDSKAICERLHAVFPQGKILIVLREQKSVILSAYKQHVRVGGRMSLDRFLHPPENAGNAVPLFRGSFYEYDRLISAYQEQFGADRICVVTFEQFKSEPSAFIETIRSFVGLTDAIDLSERTREKSLPALTGLATSLQRHLNVFVRNEVNPMGWSDKLRVRHGIERVLKGMGRVLPKAITSWPDQGRKQAVASFCEGRYAESNRKTAELTGIDLGSYGYDVGD